MTEVNWSAAVDDYTDDDEKYEVLGQKQNWNKKNRSSWFTKQQRLKK